MGTPSWAQTAPACSSPCTAFAPGYPAARRLPDVVSLNPVRKMGKELREEESSSFLQKKKEEEIIVSKSCSIFCQTLEHYLRQSILVSRPGIHQPVSLCNFLMKAALHLLNSSKNTRRKQNKQEKGLLEELQSWGIFSKGNGCLIKHIRRRSPNGEAPLKS